MGFLEEIATNPSYQGIVVIIIVISSIIGIITYFKKEKPKIKVEFISANWYKRNEHSLVTTFSVRIRVHNKGDRNTTIHSAKLKININEKEFQMDSDQLADVITSSSSILIQLIFNLGIDQILIDDDIKNSTLILNHTYGAEKIQIPLIKKP